MVSCKIKLNVIVAYRPPGSGSDEFINNQLDEVIDIVQGKKQTALCIAGDFNTRDSLSLSQPLIGLLRLDVTMSLKQ